MFTTSNASNSALKEFLAPTNDTQPGKSFPLGATIYPDGVNFCIFSHAQGIELLLFDDPEAPQPSRVIVLDPKVNCSCNYWHIFIPGLKSGQVYAYRAYGPYLPEKGLRFDGSKVLLDPYAKAIAGEGIYDRQIASQPIDNCAQSLRGIVVDTSTYDWQGDRHPRTPYASSIIYEMHVGAFTNHPNSGISQQKRGTFAGLIEKIPYLQELGITAVELLPIQSFDANDAPKGLKNYWGYSTINFFSLHNSYSSRADPLGALDEFRDLVKALHQAGIEVILDVVFNHTAEGNHQGPTISWRGLDNQTYYILSEDAANYHNYSGCGNSLKANHPVVGRFIIDCLRYWVTQMHVDGFRFDLASVLARDAAGASLWHTSIITANILWAIESDPVLAGTKLIAEPWDASGLYGVGRFVDLGDWFSEWNGPFRDDVRRFIKGDSGMVSSLAARILASPDIYSRSDTDINRSINFVTCHDGFTLNDLVSYNQKHNQANREDSRDGANDNYSWNCGIEGATEDPEIAKLRLKQIKNFFTVLLMSQGTPMILMGDEVRRTQQGNNNTYCQNNELAWFDWSLTEKNQGLFRFVNSTIALIQGLEVFRLETPLATERGSEPYLIWHGVKLNQPDDCEDSHYVGFTLAYPKFGECLQVMFNAYWESLTYELPQLLPEHNWYRIIDTSLTAPEDFCDLKTAPLVADPYYQVAPRSSVVLMAKYDT
ncbi:glycogen debranching enzyme GlgX [Xenococcus sp. PCC 7305]|uniref:glycogen debranching protein GlgX n=1 Tax=Xenococcus sp. PCC 7305 TaxID=102125 RepID=UPI0002AC3445|nr:glycogen debranching protein GlgX [Xenococcus sp. PCC 7305]ELS00742.1 glycogen debranching enzyme GlgX [Xenococcus sp. PCC 7305]